MDIDHQKMTCLTNLHVTHPVLDFGFRALFLAGSAMGSGESLRDRSGIGLFYQQIRVRCWM